MKLRLISVGTPGSLMAKGATSTLMMNINSCCLCDAGQQLCLLCACMRIWDDTGLCRSRFTTDNGN